MNVKEIHHFILGLYNLPRRMGGQICTGVLRKIDDSLQSGAGLFVEMLQTLPVALIERLQLIRRALIADELMAW